MDNILNYQRQEEDDCYKILGCDETANMEQILTEFKVLSLQHHPDKNPENEEAVLKFQKILKAKEVLSDPEKRAMYDKWRRSGFSIPFEQFLNLNRAAHTSVHWVSKKKKDLMLEDGCDCDEVAQPNLSECQTSSFCRSVAWERDPPCKLLEKFRNYEI